MKSSGLEVAIWWVGVGFALGSFLLAPLWAKALMIGVLMMVFTQDKVFHDSEAEEEQEEWRAVMTALAAAVKKKGA